jgi:hypothetical protein
LRHRRNIDVIEKSWDAFHQTLRNREMAIVVGAGVSYASGFPDWSTLTGELLRAAKIDVECLRELSLPLTAQIEMARQVYSDRSDDWPELVRKILYRHFDKTLRKLGTDDTSQGSRKDSNPALAHAIKQKNPTLAAIVELCSKRTASSTYVKNQRIGALLTYNIDGLLQVYDRALHGSPRILRTIERASAGRRPDKVNLYHLHGYLMPQKGLPGDETADKLILTETEYHDRTDDAYSFANSALLSALREFPCIFVGCSMADELMRRSLYRSLKERKDALRREGADNQEKRWRRHYAVVKVCKRACVNTLRDRDLRMLGVNPLWVSNFEVDLPRRLERLSELLRDVSA